MSIPGSVKMEKKYICAICVSQQQLFFRFYHQEVRKANHPVSIHSHTQVYIIYNALSYSTIIFGHGLK